MDNEKKLQKIVAWAGIVALIAIPVVVFLKSKKADRRNEPTDSDESDIFTSELDD